MANTSLRQHWIVFRGKRIKIFLAISTECMIFKSLESGGGGGMRCGRGGY